MLVDTVVLRPSARVFAVCEDVFCSTLLVLAGKDAAAAVSCSTIVAVPLPSELPMVICFRVAVKEKPVLWAASCVLLSC